MCWNATVSLNTYIVALFGTVFSIANGFPINVALWMHTFSSMQLVEYFIWKNINDIYWNQFFSYIGLFVITLQSIASILLINDVFLRTAMLLSYLFVVTSLLFMYYPWHPYTTLVSTSRHLRWKWLPELGTDIPLYFISAIWLFFFLVPIFISKYYILGIGCVIALIISLVTYFMSGTWASMWCWIANGIWLFVIGYVALDGCKK